MKKVFPLLFFIFSWVLTLHAQTKNQHILGANAEFSNMPAIINRKAGFNLTYVYAYKLFCLRVEAGVLQSRNFGTFYKTVVNAGLTTDINLAISIHLTVGIGGFTNYNTYTENGIPYSAEIGNTTANTGILLRPFHNERFYTGLDFMLTRYNIYPAQSMTTTLIEAYSKRGALFGISFSVNYKLNNPHKNQTKSNSLPEKH